jgi:hypothetical protein
MQPAVLRCVCDVVCVYVSMLLCAVLVVYGCVYAVAVAMALWYWRVISLLVVLCQS